MVKTRTFIQVLSSLGAKDYSSIAVVSRPVKPAIKTFLDSIEVIEENHYRINSKIKINKDFEFPTGIYHIAPEAGILAQNCKITILPGTIFYFSDYSVYWQEGGQFNAVGTEKEKIQFLAEENTINGWTSLSNLEARIEHFKTFGFKGLNEDGRQLDSPLAIRNSKTYFKNCELTGNHALMHGGGAYIEKGKATFDECIIARNSAEQIGGGGVSANAAEVEFNKTKIMNNHVKTCLGGGVKACVGCKFRFYDCQITGNTGKMAGVAVLKSESYFKKTIIRNNLCTGIGLVGPNTKAELDDDCIIEGNGQAQLLEGMHGGKIRYNKKILKEKTEPGPNNLWAVAEELRKKQVYQLQDENHIIKINRIQKKYNLGQPEMDTLYHVLLPQDPEVQKNIENWQKEIYKGIK